MLSINPELGARVEMYRSSNAHSGFEGIHVVIDVCLVWCKGNIIA